MTTLSGRLRNLATKCGADTQTRDTMLEAADKLDGSSEERDLTSEQDIDPVAVVRNPLPWCLSHLDQRTPPDTKSDEVEVTPEMIEAGRREIEERWSEFTSSDEGPNLWDEVLTAVYRAMSEVRRERERSLAALRDVSLSEAVPAP